MLSRKYSGRIRANSLKVDWRAKLFKPFSLKGNSLLHCLAHPQRQGIRFTRLLRVRGVAGCIAAGFALLGMQSRICAQPGENLRIMYKAPPAPKAPPTPGVARLIDQLSDTSATRRETAAKSLLQMGEQIEPQLRWALAQLKESIPSNNLETQYVYHPYPGEQEGRAIVMPRYAEHVLPVLIDHLEDRRKEKGRARQALSPVEHKHPEEKDADGQQRDSRQHQHVGN